MRITTRSIGSLAFAVIWNLVTWPLAGFLLYQSLWVSSDPTWSSLIVLSFPLVGIAIGWKALRGANRGASEEAVPEDMPWKARPAWKTNELTDKAPGSSKTTLFAVLWNLMAWPIAGYVLYESLLLTPEPEWPFLFVLIFPAFGLFLGWKVVRRVLHQRKFGTSTLLMDTMPARLGRRLQARLQTQISLDESPDDGFHVQLSCYHRYVRVTHDSDGGRDREVRKDLKWRDEKRIRGRTATEGTGIEVPISFDLPPDYPPSTPRKTEERMLWELRVTADLPGLDYEAEFEVPVFEPDETEADAPSFEEEEEQEGGVFAETGDEVFWDLPGDEEDDGAPAELQHQSLTEEESGQDPYADYEVGGDFTEPESDGINMERLPGGGLQFEFEAGRNLGMALLVGLVGAVFAGFGVFAVSNDADLGGAVLLGIGGLILYYGMWRMLVRSTLLTVGKGTVTVEHKGLFGTISTEKVPCPNVLDVRVETSGKAGNSALYRLVLYRAGAEGAKEAAEGTEQAEQVLSFMQNSGLVGEETGSTVVQKMRKNAEKYGQDVKIADHLTNNQEADWIAEQLLGAVEHESRFA